MIIHNLRIKGKVGIIEGEIHTPEKIAVELKDIQSLSTTLVILCHPHPQYGGNMLNNVINALFHELPKYGFATVRFNFRGVGRSEGKYDGGYGEQEDLKSVCDYFLKKNSNYNYKQIILCGYSFGATIAGAIFAQAPEYVGYISISYPITFIPDFLDFIHVRKPKFFIMGDKDDFTTSKDFISLFEKLPEPKQKKIIAGINHFWMNAKAESLLISEIKNWLVSFISE